MVPSELELSFSDLQLLINFFLSGDIPQSFDDVERPPLSSQTSVEDLSNKIARGILLTQVSTDSKTNIPIIDLITSDSSDQSELSSADTSKAESWIESVESFEFEDAQEFPADEKKENNIKNNDSKTIVVVSDEKSAQQNIHNEKSTANTTVSDEKVIVTTSIKNKVLDEKPIECKTTQKNISAYSDVLLKAVDAVEFIPSWFAPQVCSSEYEYTSYEEQFDHSFAEEDIVLNVLNDIILALQENPGDFDSCIEHLTEHLVNFVTQEETLKKVVDTIIRQVCMFIASFNISFPLPLPSTSAPT